MRLSGLAGRGKSSLVINPELIRLGIDNDRDVVEFRASESGVAPGVFYDFRSTDSISFDQRIFLDVSTYSTQGLYEFSGPLQGVDDIQNTSIEKYIKDFRLGKFKLQKGETFYVGEISDFLLRVSVDE